MARTGSQPFKLWAISATILAIAGIAAVGFFFLQSKLDRYGNLPAFPVDSYLEGRRMWSDDFYLVEGSVEDVLHKGKSGGFTVVSVLPANSDRRLPIFLEDGESSPKISRNQRLKMQVSVDSEARIRCLHFKKQ